MEPQGPLKPYEIPVAEGMSPDDAKLALDAVYAAGGCDPRHPYVNRRHPQARAMQKAVEALHAIYAEREPDPTPFDLALRDAEEKRNALRAEVQAEVASLVDLGFEEAEIPEDIQPHHLTALKMRRLAAQEDFKGLTPLLEKELRGHKASGATWTLLSALTDTVDTPDESRSEIAAKLIAWIRAANAKRSALPPFGKPKPSTPDMEDEE